MTIRTITIAAAATALLLLPVLASANDFTAPAKTGRASVIDGDTIEVHGTRYRLHGIDAPESDQTCQDAAKRSYRCGQKAALALSDKIGTRPVTCITRDIDRYGRSVAVCHQGSVDLNRWMVVHGHAVAYARYSRDYVADEASAKAAKAGIWAGSFTQPDEHRRQKSGRGTSARQDKPPQGAPTADCQIKGNINARGERIYHTPDRASWAKTRIDEGSGERWFCTEGEAEAAGWRRPKNK